MRIRLEGLSKNYGSLTALEAVTAQIDPGQVVALLGPNGAGKTTLLRCMAGMISPSAGRVVYDDREFNRGMMDLRKRMFFCRMFRLFLRNGASCGTWGWRCGFTRRRSRALRKR